MKDVAQTLIELYGTRSLEKIVDQFEKKIKKRDADPDALFQEYLPALWYGQSFGTVATRYSAFRKPLKRMRSKRAKRALELFTFPAAGFDLLKKRQDEKALEKKNTQEFDSSKVSELISKIHEMIETEKFPSGESRQKPKRIEAYWLAAYLALATGRRFAEVLKTMDISKHGTKVKITGLTKKSPGEDILDGACLLDDYKTVKKALTRLREIFRTNHMSVDKVGKKHSYTFNRYLKQKILEDDSKSFHDLRAMYAEECWKRYGKDSGMSHDDFIGHVLGHKKFVTATDHYLKFKS
jgi:hypothetical protein